MDNQKQQVIDRLKQANNVLVTVKNNPSVDQLAACIGLSLALNKLNKHATAVFSGEVPSTIEFLKPEQTIEKDTDSLRDFIISLDKSKADKLRYKLEDNVVRIFITPYRTSISEDDLEFSQGDFNVDVVLALGIHEQGDVDTAITSHGRILHDATVITVNNTEGQGREIGSISWLDAGASSLSEMATELATALDKDILDEQIATAMLTGIVAETARFSNEKTSADTMNASALLMAAGANQQLVATKLEEPEVPAETEAVQDENQDEEEPGKNMAIDKDGTLQINHDREDTTPKEQGTDPEPEVPAEQPQNEDQDNQADAETNLAATEPRGRTIISDPLETAAPDASNDAEKPLESLSLPPIPDEPPLLEHEPNLNAPIETDTKPKDDGLNFDELKEAIKPKREETDLHKKAEVHSTETLADIERQVNSPHVAQSAQAEQKPEENHVEELDLSQLQRPKGLEDDASQQLETPGTSHVDEARNAVEEAIQSAGAPPAPSPIAALNAQPLGDPIHTAPPAPDAAQASVPPMPSTPSPEGINEQQPPAPAFPSFEPVTSPDNAQASSQAPQFPQPTVGSAPNPVIDAPEPAPFPSFPLLPNQNQPNQQPAPVSSTAPPVPPPITPPTFGQQ